MGGRMHEKNASELGTEDGLVKIHEWLEYERIVVGNLISKDNRWVQGSLGRDHYYTPAERQYMEKVRDALDLLHGYVGDEIEKSQAWGA